MLISAAFLTQTVCLDDIVVKFEIWDTAGQERYHSLAPMYYRGAQAAIVMYDITNQVSRSMLQPSHFLRVGNVRRNFQLDKFHGSLSGPLFGIKTLKYDVAYYFLLLLSRSFFRIIITAIN